MTDHTETLPSDMRTPEPIVRRITTQDIVEALAAGIRDLWAEPRYGLFFGLTYALAGIAIIASLFVYNLVYLAYPLCAGFAMLGPFVASGLYEVSRRRQTGAPLSFPIVFGAIWEQRRRELSWMAFVAVFLFMMWMYQVRLLTALFLGFHAFGSLSEFITTVTTTPEGITFLIVGHLFGAILSLIAYSISVVSFPLLVDRDVDFITAIITSFRAVATSPGPMILWAGCVVALMVVAVLPMFIGLIVVLPLLGHTTWHLFQRLVEPAASTNPA